MSENKLRVCLIENKTIEQVIETTMDAIKAEMIAKKQMPALIVHCTATKVEGGGIKVDSHDMGSIKTDIYFRNKPLIDIAILTMSI